MTRDAELPARDYVQLVLAGVDAETDISVVQSLLTRVQTALRSLRRPGLGADRLGRRWPTTRWRALRGRRARQRPAAAVVAHVRQRRPHARSTPPCCAACSTAPDTVEGLAVDADARWAFLSGLVAIGAAGDAEIDAEVDRDATATGHPPGRHRAGAAADGGVEGGDLAAGLPRRRRCPTRCTRRSCRASGTRPSAS